MTDDVPLPPEAHKQCVLDALGPIERAWADSDPEWNWRHFTDEHAPGELGGYSHVLNLGDADHFHVAHVEPRGCARCGGRWWRVLSNARRRIEPDGSLAREEPR